MATRLEIIKAEQAKLDRKLAKENLRLAGKNLELAAREFQKNPTAEQFQILSECMCTIQARMEQL